jgi:hypothetical protein
MTLRVVLNKCENVSHIKEGNYPEGFQNWGLEKILAFFPEKVTWAVEKYRDNRFIIFTFYHTLLG